MRLKERRGPDANDAAVPLRQTVVRSGSKVMDKCGECCTEHQQTNDSQPRIAQAGAIDHQRKADAGEKQHRKCALAESEKDAVCDECARWAAKILYRSVWIDGVARPIRGMKAAEGQQQEYPGGDAKGDQSLSDNVRAFHWNRIIMGLYDRSRRFHVRCRRGARLQLIAQREPHRSPSARYACRARRGKLVDPG